MDKSYTGKPCPKCAHVRAVSDNGPDWQCPNCGIAYTKFQKARSAPAVEAAVDRDGDEAARGTAAQPYTRTKFLIHLAIALGLLIPVLLTVAHVTVKELFLILVLMAVGSYAFCFGVNQIRAISAIQTPYSARLEGVASIG